MLYFVIRHLCGDLPSSSTCLLLTTVPVLCSDLRNNYSIEKIRENEIPLEYSEPERLDVYEICIMFSHALFEVLLPEFVLDNRNKEEVSDCVFSPGFCLEQHQGNNDVTPTSRFYHHVFRSWEKPSFITDASFYVSLHHYLVVDFHSIIYHCLYVSTFCKVLLFLEGMNQLLS